MIRRSSFFCSSSGRTTKELLLDIIGDIYSQQQLYKIKNICDTRIIKLVVDHPRNDAEVDYGVGWNRILACFERRCATEPGFVS